MQNIHLVKEFLHQLGAGATSPLVRYLAFGACIVLSISGAMLLCWILRHIVAGLTSKTKTQLDDDLLDVTNAPIVWMVAVSGIYAGFRFLHPALPIAAFCHKCYLAVMILLGVRMMLRATRVLGNALVSHIDTQNMAYGDLLATLLRPIFKVVLWIIAILILMKHVFGINIGALLAGAGIITMAVAFAAQNTIANIFGAISLIFDRPFRLGDRIQIGDKEGLVETIGLRSTRLRALDGTVWNIPNRTMTDTPIHNYTMRPSFKEVFTVTLTYKATADDVRRGKEILHGILDKHPLFTKKQPPVIIFSEMGDYSLNLQAICFFHTSDFNKFRQAKEEILFQILEKFNEAKLDIAFPTQTVCIEQSGK